LRSEPGQVLLTTIEHPRAGTYEAVGNPVLWNGERLPVRSAPPALGEHTDEIVRELKGPDTRR
jgi:crotonobetainyl-CoA:carnitine CoA-transferase CaiB-like acyl-CoA transferase